MNTMNQEQALEVLKEQLDINVYNFGESNELTQALTIAIECMEATQSLTDYLTEQAKTTESRELADIFKTIIRGLNNPTK